MEPGAPGSPGGRSSNLSKCDVSVAESTCGLKGAAPGSRSELQSMPSKKAWALISSAPRVRFGSGESSIGLPEPGFYYF